MSKSTCLWVRQLSFAALGFALAVAISATAIAQGDGLGPSAAGFEPDIPASYNGSGSFFSRQLGTALRFDYRTEGYGTQSGVVSIGGMKVASVNDGETWFLDAQGTLSDDFGGGFNAGAGYRVLTDVGFGFDPQRIHGLGFWVDGQSTQADNFFSQLGFSLESLGDSVDLRLNGQFPLERTEEGDPTLTSIDELSYVGNNLFSGTEDVIVDTAHSVVDGEIAKRIHNLEAWAFLGGYHLGGGGLDTAGYRVGVRGYAVPDLALSLQVTDDDVYHTNVMFGITWFVGRTTRRNAPGGTLLDRFREPVQRNNFIATTSIVRSQASGDALTDSETSETMRIVHVDSSAAAGGDGTFENPYQFLSDASGVGNSMENDKVLVYSDSVLNGAQGSFTAQNGQDVLGEGVDANGDAVSHFVGTVENGLIALPETSTDSSLGATPIINGSGDVFTLADDNAINNFVINGGDRAVIADTVANPSLANLSINGMGTDFTNGAIVLTEVTGTTVIENTVVIDKAVGPALFIDGGEDGMSIAAEINDSQGRAMVIQNRTGGLITYSGTVNDLDTVSDLGDSEGILIDNNENTQFAFTGTLNLETGASNAVTISNNNGAAGLDTGTQITFSDLIATSTAGNTVEISDGGDINFLNSTTLASITNTGAGDAVKITGDLFTDENNAIVNIAAAINNSDSGNAVDIQNRSANNVSVTGPILGQGDGILLAGNTDGNYSFTGEVDMITNDSNGVTMTNNEGATVTFNDLTISTSGTGNALEVTGGGTLTITDPNATNDIKALGTGAAVKITGDTNAVATGDSIVSIDALVSSQNSARSVDIQDRTSNDVTFNNTVTDEGAGLLAMNNSGGNIIFTDTVTTNTGDNNGITLTSNTDTTISFNGLDITTTGTGTGFEATGGGNLLVTSPAGTNTINATGDGSGLVLDGMNIQPGNVTFDSISTANSVAEGIKLKDLEGTGQLVIGGGTDPGDGGTLITDGIAISIDNVDNLVMSNVTVDNSADDGAALKVINQDGGTVTFNGLNVTTSDLTTAENAIDLNNNTGGTITFNTLTAETVNGDVVSLNTNTGTTINFSDIAITSSTGGDGFRATGGGDLSVTGTNTIQTENGTALNLNGVEIAATGVTFDTINVDAGTAGGIILRDLTGTGQVALGGGTNPGDGGTLITDGAAIIVDNVDNLLLTNITVDNSANTGIGLDVMNQDGGTVTFDGLNITTIGASNAVGASNNTGGTIAFDDLTTSSVNGDGVNLITNTGATFTFNDMDITASGSGRGFKAETGGTITATGTNTISTTNGLGLSLNAVTIGAADFTIDTIDVNGASNGIVLTSLSGTDQVKIDGGTLATTGTAITVNNVDNLLITDVTVNNTAGAGLNVTGQNGGTATFTNLNITTTTADAVDVNTNTGGTIAFNNLTTSSGNGDGVNLLNNTGATITFNGMDLSTTALGTGIGFNASGGGNLSATGTNNIDTALGTGAAIDIDGMTIGTATFTNVVTDGAATGIDLSNLTGGQLTVGNSTTASTINDSDNAITVTNAANVDLINIDVTDASVAALTLTNDNINAMNVSVDDLTVDNIGGAGIVANHTGDGNFTVAVDDSDIESTVNFDANGEGTFNLTFENTDVETTTTDVAFTLAIKPEVDEANVTIRDNLFESADATAFDMDITSVGSKTVNFLFDDNTSSNSSLDTTVEIDASQASILNATIVDSTFNNANVGGDNFDIASNSATTVINMHLNNNTADGGVGNYTLRELNSSNFSIQERDTVEARNNGGFTFDSLPAGDVTDFDDIISVDLP